MTSRRAVRRLSVAVLGVVVLSAGLAACGPERVAGTRCYQDIWAHDATHLLRCINGRWQRVITRDQANAFWKAVAEKEAAKKQPPPPPPAPPAPTVPPAGWAAKTIAAGTRHTCAVAKGLVKCWGQGTGGQLGDGKKQSSAFPVTVTGITDAVSVAASEFGTCAVLATRAVKCWGTNVHGELGPEKYVPFGTPGDNIITTPVALPITGISQVDLGVGFGCAVRGFDRTVWCWGAQSSGRLGNGNIAGPAVLTPSFVLGQRHAVAVSAGGAHACALWTDGRMFCWGSNSSGQLGTNAPTTGYPNNQTGTPVPVKYWSTLLLAKTVETSINGTCALDLDGRPFCWGENTFGQTGIGEIFGGAVSPGYLPLAVAPIPGVANMTRLAAGSQSFCGRIVGGAAKCWGRNNARVLGTPVAYFSITPQTVSPLTGATDIVAGPEHACARRANDTIFCWGAQSGGRLGNGSLAYGFRPPSPVVVPVPGTSDVVMTVF